MLRDSQFEQFCGMHGDETLLVESSIQKITLWNIWLFDKKSKVQPVQIKTSR